VGSLKDGGDVGVGSNIVHGLKEADVPLLGGFEELEGSILWVDLGVGVGLGVGSAVRIGIEIRMGIGMGIRLGIGRESGFEIGIGDEHSIRDPLPELDKIVQLIDRKIIIREIQARHRTRLDRDDSIVQIDHSLEGRVDDEHPKPRTTQITDEIEVEDGLVDPFSMRPSQTES
jgi:hypothetical protein